MRSSGFWVMAAALMFGGGVLEPASAQDALVENIEYVQGFPAYPKKMRGVLRVGADGLVFASGGQDRFTLKRETVDYIAAEAQARQRATTADAGFYLASTLTDAGLSSALSLALKNPTPILDLRGLGLPLLGAAPLMYVLREKETNLLTVEYLEGDAAIRRLVVFRVRKNSATTVKKLLDQTLGLTPDHYQDREREEETRRREYEQQATPAGEWEASRNTVVGDNKRSQILVEQGKYEVLLSPRYVGLRPEGMSWAKYRVPVREFKARKGTPRPLRPVHRYGRLVGFEVGGVWVLFY